MRVPPIDGEGREKRERKREKERGRETEPVNGSSTNA